MKDKHIIKKLDELQNAVNRDAIVRAFVFLKPYRGYDATHDAIAKARKAVAADRPSWRRWLLPTATVILACIFVYALLRDADAGTAAKKPSAQ